MSPENFCYWLQGYFEIEGNQPRHPEHQDTLNSSQIKMIKEHLQQVFLYKQTSVKVDKFDFGSLDLSKPGSTVVC